MRLIAGENGYNVAMCEAMITLRMEIWKVRNPRTREVRFVDAAQARRYVSGGPGERPMDFSPAPDGPWEYLGTVDGPKELVTMTTDEALALGFAERVFEDMEALKRHYNVVAEPRVLGDKWSERVIDFLSSPAVMGLLLFVGVLCAYVEMHTPGFGAAGIAAILCCALFFGNQFLTGMANYLEIGLFVVGVVLLIVEIFVTPGFGVLGVAGMLCCGVALLTMLVANPPDKLPFPDTDLDWSVFSHGALAMATAFIAAIIAAAIVARYLPEVPVAGQLVLPPPEVPAAPPATEDAEIVGIQPGQVGKVVQICRPVGKVQIEGKLCDAIADGAFLPAGTGVVVLRNEGNRIVVEEKTG